MQQLDYQRIMDDFAPPPGPPPPKVTVIVKTKICANDRYQKDGKRNGMLNTMNGWSCRDLPLKFSPGFALPTYENEARVICKLIQAFFTLPALFWSKLGSRERNTTLVTLQGPEESFEIIPR